MHYQGIVPGRPFPVGRPLSDNDHKHRLRQDVRIESPSPYADLSVIHLNSTFLEVVDKYYGWKGWVTFMIGVISLMMFSFGLWFLLYGFGQAGTGDTAGVFSGLLAAFLLWTFAFVAVRLGRFEWAYYTHYPIRLNRKRRLVRVLRKDGSTLTAPWDDVFFTLDQDAGFWEVRGHVLEHDGETIKETFALGAFRTLNNSEGMPMLLAHWEFFRRYMEEGPAAVARYVTQALPVDGKKESFRVGYEVLASHFRAPGNAGTVLAVIGWPIIAVSSVGRWIAMRLSRIPKWPDEIEEVDRVEADDPYTIDARINPPELR